jgi:glutaredoxin
MDRKTIVKQCLLTLAALVCTAGASAQMYKWKDDKGVVHFGDKPPASVLDKTEVKSYAGPDGGPELPYALTQAVRANPVVLYTAANCAPCDQARGFLRQRGIPHSEKSVKTAHDRQALKEAGGELQLPLLLVGRSRLVGFAASGWNDALDAAQYPPQPMLPRGYQFAAATPAAPPKPSPQVLAKAADAERAAKAAAEAEEQAKFAPRPKAINGTPDFQF